MTSGVPTYTVIQADGLYPDETLEMEALRPRDGEKFQIRYLQTFLYSPGTSQAKPWSDIEKSLRDQVDGILVLKMKFTAADIALFPRLKVIVRMGVGYDMLDRKTLAERGVMVCNVPDYGTDEVADHTIGLALALRRGILLHHERQRASPPAPWLYVDTPLVSRIRDSTFGIIGFGRIGMAVALRAKAFGWKVLMYDPYVPNGIEKTIGVERIRSLDELFRRSTTLSINCPSTRETRGLVGYELLSKLPRGATIVNTGRGEVLDLDSLERAMKEDIVSGAGLDVVPLEPIPSDNVHPLFQAYRRKEQWLEGRLTITAHTAFYSPESFVDIRIKSIETMRRALIEGARGLSANEITPEMD